MKSRTACCSLKSRKTKKILRPLHGVHIEVILAGGYALLLVGVAAILEMAGPPFASPLRALPQFRFRLQTRNWTCGECPTGHHLTREQTDFERKIALYRAPAHKCNACHCKKDCTDSDDGRVLESRLDAWLQSELRRFHRGISLSVAAAGRPHSGGGNDANTAQLREWILLGVLLAPIGICRFKTFGFILGTRAEKLNTLVPGRSQKLTDLRPEALQLFSVGGGEFFEDGFTPRCEGKINLAAIFSAWHTPHITFCDQPVGQPDCAVMQICAARPVRRG